MSYRDEVISKAGYWYRQGNWSGKDIFGFHVGVVIHTTKGNKYLIHHVPDNVPIVTDANMSSKWRELCSLQVSGTVTIGDVMTACGNIKWAVWSNCVNCSIRAAKRLSDSNTANYTLLALEAWAGKEKAKQVDDSIHFHKDDQ